MRLRIIGPPHPQVNRETKRVHLMYPCSDMVLRSKRDIAKCAKAALASIEARIQRYGIHSPRVFALKGKLYRQPMKPAPDLASSEYERKVNALIPKAEKYANKQRLHGHSWNKVYHNKMTELKRAAGLIR